MTTTCEWLVEERCPQCGGPVSMRETERVLTCGYCRVRLYVVAGEVPRYCLPVKPAPIGTIVMVPYWRVRGSRFEPCASGFEGVSVDATALACEVPGLPRSLGVRAQAVPLRFASPSDDMRFLGSGLAFQHSARLTPADGDEAGSDVRFAEMRDLTPIVTVSLVYSPVRVTPRSVFDAVLNRRIAGIDGEAWARAAGDGDDRPAPVHFVPTICAQCGWQLEGASSSLVLHCPNCGTAWGEEGGHLRQVAFERVPGPGWRPDAHLPFWRVEAAASWADFVRLANLPLVAQPGWEREPISFWIPAFQVHPGQFLRLAQTLTLARVERRRGLEPESRTRGCLALTLPGRRLDAAVALLLASLSRPGEDPRPLLRGLRTDAPALVYVPVRSNGREHVNEDLQLAVQRATG